MKAKIPLYVFDEHHEAFYYWHKARREGFIPRALDLYHIDAHPDAGFPGPFKRSIYGGDHSAQGGEEFYWDFAREELGIDRFILPAILTNIVRHFYFIYPRWRKIRPARKKTTISSVFGEGKILKQGIQVGRGSDPRVRKAYPDLKTYLYSMQQIDRVPQERKVLLDIDLDYFACIDSITNHLSYSLEITRREYLSRRAFFAQPSLPFSGLNFSFSRRKGKYYAKVAHRPQKENAHLPPMEEIEGEIAHLIANLKVKNIIPAVITICRSAISGFCPRDQAQLIEQKLIHSLRGWLNF